MCESWKSISCPLMRFYKKEFLYTQSHQVQKLEYRIFCEATLLAPHGGLSGCVSCSFSLSYSCHRQSREVRKRYPVRKGKMIGSQRKKNKNEKKNRQLSYLYYLISTIQSKIITALFLLYEELTIASCTLIFDTMC